MTLVIHLRQAEFEHVLEQAEQRSRRASDSDSPISVELFDALDSFPEMELRDVVAIYLYGLDGTLADFYVARCRADAIGWDGVNLLHQDKDLHQVLRAGLDRLKSAGSITWVC